MAMIGRTLGNFECTALLGKAGVGEVYRAKDQKLGRDVAIKASGESFNTNGNGVLVFGKQSNKTWKIIYSIWSDESLIRPQFE